MDSPAVHPRPHPPTTSLQILHVLEPSNATPMVDRPTAQNDPVHFNIYKLLSWCFVIKNSVYGPFFPTCFINIFPLFKAFIRQDFRPICIWHFFTFYHAYLLHGGKAKNASKFYVYHPKYYGKSRHFFVAQEALTPNHLYYPKFCRLFFNKIGFFVG